MKPSDFRLGDDGTLDTVIVCRHCGEELRYNFANDSVTDGDSEESYDSFVDWAKEDASEQHDCGEV